MVLILGVILFALLVWLWYIKRNHRKVIVRFMRPTCKFCVESQAEWDAFKAQAEANNADFDVVEVNISDNSIHTRNWLARFQVDGVPKVIKVIGTKIEEYQGPRISTAYMQFATA